MGGTLGVRSHGGGGVDVLVRPAARAGEGRGRRRRAGRRCAEGGESPLRGRQRDKTARVLLLHLRDAGMVADSAADALGALDALVTAAEKGSKYALAVLDHHMPGIDGVSSSRAG